MSRVWDEFLTDNDKAHLAAVGEPRHVGFGARPALLLIDNYESAVGENVPLLEAIKRGRSAIGERAWMALSTQVELLALFRKLDLPVIHATGGASGNIPPWSWCITHPEERGALRGPVPMRPADYEIVEQVAPNSREFTVTKVAPSAFSGTPLVGLLTFLAVDTVVVVGESTSGCVRATVVDAVSNRYRVIVAEECVYDRHEASHAINLFDMNQKYADVIPTSEVVDHLHGAFGSPVPAVAVAN